MAALTGADCPELFGPLTWDRPALARDVVRYAGEPVALVVAQDEQTHIEDLSCDALCVHTNHTCATSYRASRTSPIHTVSRERLTC